MMEQLTGLQAAPAHDADDFLGEVLRGLSLPQKALPSRFFYDERGSDLFEQITQLPEYYPTRAEIKLLRTYAEDIKEMLPSGAVIVEFGSGSSLKTELLLEALERPRAYLPIEISASALYPAAERIQQKFPGIGVHPILGGFHDLGAMKLPLGELVYAGFFPGSTIGNLTRKEAVAFLKSARRLLGRNALFIIGADLQKPLDVLLPAYDDAQGVTAAFNLNILERINRELDGTFDLGAFVHQARYNGQEGRIEMHLGSVKAQSASVAGHSFAFRAGETIHTENSHKYSVSGFHLLAREGGWSPVATWTGEDGLFSLHLLA